MMLLISVKGLLSQLKTEMNQLMVAIEKMVCEHRVIDPAELHTGTQFTRVARVRQIVMYLGSILKLSLYEVSEFYGLDHSTASHGKRTINRLRHNPGREARLLDIELHYYESRIGIGADGDFSYIELIAEIKQDIVKAEENIERLRVVVKRLEDKAFSADPNEELDRLSRARNEMDLMTLRQRAERRAEIAKKLGVIVDPEGYL